MGVCVAAWPAWRGEHSREGRTVEKHNRMSGVAPLWMCACARTALGMLGEVHSHSACADSPWLCSRTGGTQCGECLITSGVCQPALSPGLLRPCRHLCPGAFCPAWHLACVRVHSVWENQFYCCYYY